MLLSFKTLLFLSLFLQVAFSENEHTFSESEIELLQKRFFFDATNKEVYCSWSTGCKSGSYCKHYRGLKVGECVAKKSEAAFCLTDTECSSDNCSWFKCKGKQKLRRI